MSISYTFTRFYLESFTRGRARTDCKPRPTKPFQRLTLFFCHPKDSQRAVEQGLKLAQDGVTLKKSPGVVMGLFAYAHPFLDGNGRTMLVVHTVLCHRAGFSIHWARTGKSDYLSALGEEIETPDKGILDAYLKDFIAPPLDRPVGRLPFRLFVGLMGSLLQILLKESLVILQYLKSTSSLISVEGMKSND